MSDVEVHGDGPASPARARWVPWVVVAVAGVIAICIAIAVLALNADPAAPQTLPSPSAPAAAPPSATPETGCRIVEASVDFPDEESVARLPASAPRWVEIGRVPLRAGTTLLGGASTVHTIGGVTIVGTLVKRADGTTALVYAGFDPAGERLWEKSFLGVSDLDRSPVSDIDANVIVIQLSGEWGGTTTFLSVDVQTGTELASVDVAGAYFTLPEAIVRHTYDPLYRTAVEQPRELVHIVKAGGLEARWIDTLELAWERPIETPEDWEGIWASLAGDVIVVHEQLYSAFDGTELAASGGGWFGVAGDRLVERRWIRDAADTVRGWDSQSGSVCWQIEGVEDFLQTAAGGIVVLTDGTIQQVDTANGSIVADWGPSTGRIGSGRLVAGGYLQDVDDGWSFIPSPGESPIAISLGADPTWRQYAHDAERIALLDEGTVRAHSLRDGAAIWSAPYEGDVHVSGGRLLSVRGAGAEIVLSELR